MAAPGSHPAGEDGLRRRGPWHRTGRAVRAEPADQLPEESVTASNGAGPGRPAPGDSVGAAGKPGSAAAGSPPGLGAFLRYFLGLGTWGFGGPIATVGYMQRDLVERRKWIKRDDFLDGVALGQTMPGPLAAQVTMWVGYLESGAFGAFAVAAMFILPSFLGVLTVAVLYRRYEGLSV